MAPTTSDTDARRGRRAVLRSGAAALAGTVGATAGCVELLPPLGRQVRFESVDEPAPGEPTYRPWSPRKEEPADLPLGVVVQPSADVASTLGADPRFGHSEFVPALDFFGVGFDNYDLAASFGSGWEVDAVLLEGPVTPDEVAETVLASGYEDDGRARGYRWFGREDGPRAIAVTDGRLLFARRPEPRGALEHLLDVREGAVPRLADADPAFDRVVRAGGQRPLVRYQFGVLPDSAGHTVRFGCSWIDVDEEWVYRGATGVFEEPVGTASEVRSTLEDAVRGPATLDVRVDGRFVEYVARYAPETFPGGVDSGRPTVPQVTWGVDERDDALVLRHEAGDPVPADRLELERDDGSALQVQFADEHQTVGPGDERWIDRAHLGDAALVVVYDSDDVVPSKLFGYGP